MSEKPLDPAIVAKIDQRAGECSARLAAFVRDFHNNSERFGQPLTLGRLAEYFQGQVQLHGLNAVTVIIDLLSTAISELADMEHDSRELEL